MTGRTRGLYRQCLARTLEVCRQETNRVPTPLRLISDYEIGILTAMQEAFPGARARGCYFHSGMVNFFSITLRLLYFYFQIFDTGYV